MTKIAFDKISKKTRLISLIAAFFILFLGGFSYFGRNYIISQFFFRTQIVTAGRNYESSFQLTYTPVRYMQKFIEVLTENSNQLVLKNLDIVKMFEDLPFIENAAKINPADYERVPQSGEMVWLGIQLKEEKPFLSLLYCIDTKDGLQYLKMDLPFENVSTAPEEILGFGVIKSAQNMIITGLSAQDWLNSGYFTQKEQNKTVFLLPKDWIPTAAASISHQKPPEKSKNFSSFQDRVFLNGNYYRFFTSSFLINDEPFGIAVYLNENSLKMPANQWFIVLWVFSPIISFVLFALVFFPRFIKKQYDDSSVFRLILRGESANLEFKSSLRYDYTQNIQNKELEQNIIKSIAAFANAQGGKLIIGVSDEGQILGLENDYKTLKEYGSDYFELHLRNLTDSFFGRDFSARQIQFRFHVFSEEPHTGKEIVIITVKASDEPVYVTFTDSKGVKAEKFYVRSGNSSRALENLSEAYRYIKKRF